MQFFKERKLRSSAKVTLIFCVIISFLIITYSQKQYNNFKRQRSQLICETAANLFKNDLQNYIVINDIIEAMIIETNGNLSKFENISQNLMAKLPGVESIQLAPKGKVSKAFPPSSSSRIGSSLFDSPDTKIGSNYALNTQKAYLTGPVTLENGDRVLIIQHPVFLKGEIDSSKFWGFTVLFLKLDSIFTEETKSFLNKNHYYYSLWKPNPQTSEIVNLTRNTYSELNKPCESVLKVANSLWTLNIEPEDGWWNPNLILTESIIAAVISLALSLTISFLVSVKDRDEALERLSYRDTLTSLYNARKFMATLKELQKKQTPYSLIYLDLNDFKQINDNLGHESGDQVLIIVGRKLSNCIREADKAFRIGGDEFAVILPGQHDPEFVLGVIARIKESISRETVLKNARLQVVSSAGFARSPEDGDDFEEVIKIADNEMYKDKHIMKAAKKAAESVDSRS